MKPRVLVIAEAANPEWVSVPLIGWSLAQALREVADVHLVTQVRNRDAILRAGLIEGRDFTAIDSEAIAKPLWALGKALRGGDGKGWTTLQLINALSYPHFERLIWKEFGPSIRAGDWDIVHRVTPLSPTISSSLARKCARVGVPFVVGPLNGGVPWPREFDAERRAEREWLSYVRGAYKALPGRKKTLRSAAAILVGSRHTWSEVPRAQQRKTVYIPENAVDLARFSGPGPRDGGPMRACFIGRMVPYKGPDMLIEAAAPLLRDGKMRLHMIGDGPMLPGLKEQARDLPGVTFHGWLEHEAVQSVAGQCEVLAFPSIREFGGGVVLEAMTMGLVPLIADYAGPAELVTEGLGVKIPMGGRDAIIAGTRDGLQRLIDDPAGRARMSAAGQARLHEAFTWPAKARQVAEVYDWVLGRRDDLPRPFPQVTLKPEDRDAA